MIENIHTYIGTNTTTELVQFCAKQPETIFTLIADENTYGVLGRQVEDAFKQAQMDVRSIVLRGEEVVADEKYLMQVFIKAAYEPQLFIAVGSGTITDITRYTSYRSGNRFVSVPTAPSVDGFISLGAPLIVGGLKDTYPTHAPLAVFADLTTLTNAPKALIAAGFGDIIGKITSLADWKLENLIWGDPFDEAVEGRVRKALQQCIDSADAIAARSPEGIRSLIEALLQSGIGMLEFGNSRPASGAEHHCSHYWEMKLLEEDRPAILHGAKVGFATILVAQQYARLGSMTREDLMDALEGAEWPSRDTQIAEIQQAYGTVGDELIPMQQPFLDLTPDQYDQVKQRVLQNWDAIRQTLESVPSPDEVKRLLQSVGGPTDRQTLGLEAEKVQAALHYGHYLRRRFTVIKLLKILGMQPEL
ncbi:MAG: sn-glycerol-1-phosphate dehydrogenase [Anaerolineaceae bacterium]|nr:sn-glycerol-1-phosphate dehydrogenase [Anaerolineaceae bacterium]